MSDYVGFLDVLAPSLWSPSFRKGPASYRICEINISNPTETTAYNPSIFDREFWTPILQSYVRVRCSPSQKERLVKEYYRDLLLEMKASWWPLLPVWGSSHIRRIWTYTHKRHKILWNIHTSLSKINHGRYKYYFLHLFSKMYHVYDYYKNLLILGLREGWRTEISQQAEIPERTLWAWPSGKYWNILKLRAAWSGMKMHMCTCNDEVAGCVSQRQLICITSFTSIAKHHVCPLIVVNWPPRVFAKRWECEIEESWPCFLARGWTCVRN